VTPDLSPRQAQALRFIARHVRTRGFPPTIRELLDEMGAVSTNWGAQVLHRLERKGYLVRMRGSARALALTDQGKRWLERGRLQ
jgi:repressor LexA